MRRAGWIGWHCSNGPSRCAVALKINLGLVALIVGGLLKFCDYFESPGSTFLPPNRLPVRKW